MIDIPSRFGQEVTARRLVVHGQIAEGARRVWLALETGDGSRVSIEAIDPTGRPRHGVIPFVTVFESSTPRRSGTVLWVVPIDGDGAPLDAARRRFVVGASADDTVPPDDDPAITRFDE